MVSVANRHIQHSTPRDLVSVDTDPLRLPKGRQQASIFQHLRPQL
jgi:hypothetical protein